MANQKHNATLTIGAALDASVGKAFGGLKRGLKGVAQETREVEKRQREIAKTRADLIKQGKAVDDLDREYDQLGKTLEGLQKQQRRLENMDRAVGRVGSSFRSLRTSAMAAGKGIAIGALAFTGAAIALVNSTANAGYEIDRLAKLSNAGTVEFQRWAAASRSVGIEDEKLSDILKDVNDRVGDFVQTGGGPMADFFEKIGPKVGVTAKHFRNLSGPQALQLYVRSLEKAGVNQQDFTFYMEAMASDSTLLLPLLRDSGREMERLGNAAAESGAIMDQDAIAASIRYRQETSKLGATLIGVKNAIGAELLPVMTQLVEKANQWVQTHGPEIREAIHQVGEAMSEVAPKALELGEGLGKVVVAGGQMTAVAADLVGGWENLGVVLGATLAGSLIFRVLAFAGAIGRLAFAAGRFVATGAAVGKVLSGIGAAALAVGPALKWGLGIAATAIRGLGAAMIANPVGATITAIALGATLLITNWDKVAPAFEWLWDRVKIAFDLAKRDIAQIVGWFRTAADGVASAWQAFSDTMTGLMNRVGEAYETAQRRAKAAIDWFKSGAATVDNAMFRAAHGENPTFRNSPIGSIREGSLFDRIIPGGKPQARAVGGAFRPGPLRVGERGEELVYANSSGFVAHRNALRGLEQRAGRIRNMAQAAASMVATPAAQRGAAGPVNITINQLPGQDPAALVREIQRQMRYAGGVGLFDGVHA